MSNKFVTDLSDFDRIMLEEGLSQYNVYSQYDYPLNGFTYIFVRLGDQLGDRVLKEVHMPESEQISINIEALSDQEKKLYLLRLAKIYDRKEETVLAPKPIFDQKKCLFDLEHYKEFYPIHSHESYILDKETVNFAIACILEREQQLKVIESVTNDLNETNKTLKTVNEQLETFTAELEKLFGSHKKHVL